MKNAWKTRGAAVIILVTVVSYLPALRAGFVFDDFMFVRDNRIVKASDGLYRFWLTKESPYYYPLTWSLWWSEWHLWGDNAAGYHVVNVLLHAVNAVLVWLILQRLKIAGAWLAALVFAVHPVNVATVAWISEQKNTLSMLFFALATLLYLRFDEEERPACYSLSLAAFALALLSKPAVVMAPVVLLGCVWWMRGRLRWKDFLRSGPFFVLSLVAGLATIWFEYRTFEQPAVGVEGLLSRLATAGWVPWFYLSKALVPVNLTVIYPKWEIDASHWVSYVPGMILVGSLLVFWWKRQTWGRPWLFGLGYFVVMFFPVLGFFDQAFFRYSWVADHWQYYSIVGVIALVVAAGAGIGRRLVQRSRSVGVVVSAAVLVVLAVATWKRSCVYANEETLWQDNVAKNPDSWVAHNNLGVALGQAGRFEDAIGHVEQALRIKPDYAEAHFNLGKAMVVLGRMQEAIGHFEQALRSSPKDAEAHYNLGNALLASGNAQMAIGHLEQAERSSPDNAGVHYNLGNALLALGRVPEAVGHWEQAVRIKPDYAEARNNLGAALAQSGRLPEAIEQFDEVVRITPDDAEAQFNLAATLEQAGRVQEAVGHYERALQLKPDYAQPQKRLAALRAGQTRLRVTP